MNTILSKAAILLLLGAMNQAHAQGKQVTANNAKGDVKFLDYIVVDMPAPANVEREKGGPKGEAPEPHTAAYKTTVPSAAGIESAERVQFKFALLLDAEVETLENLQLLRLMDEWLDTRYRLGGTSKEGIDCSALMQVVYSAVYGKTLPRTSREQYNLSTRIAAEELKEGDLVFFGTGGDVSHVGFYLRNNKFFHASSSGVMVSDLGEDYWSRRYLGAGRVDERSSLSSKP